MTSLSRNQTCRALIGAAFPLYLSILFIWAGSIAEVFSADPDVRHLVVSIVPIMLIVAVIDACQAIFGFGLAGLKRSTVSLRNVAACYGVLALAVFPAGSVDGLAGMWTASP